MIMGRCPSCGAWHFFEPPELYRSCVWCNKVFCETCVPEWVYWFELKTKIEVLKKQPDFQEVGVCSKECYDELSEKVLGYPTEDIGTDVKNFGENRIRMWWSAILHALEGKPSHEIFQQAIRLNTEKWGGISVPADEGELIGLGYKFEQKALLSLAKNLERCGRRLDAAEVYERLKMYDKARKLRESNRHVIVKQTKVSVDLNALLQQVKDGGIVAAYRCPHCGGKLKVGKETNIKDLGNCQYCGAEIEKMDLAEFLEAVLS